MEGWLLNVTDQQSNLKENQSNLDDINMQPVKSNKIKNIKSSRFCNSWLNEPAFKDWLAISSRKNKRNDYVCCKVCRLDIVAHKGVLKKHSVSEKHKFNFRQVATSTKICDIYKTSTLENNVRKAELKLCGLLTTNNLPFLLMDSLSPLLKNIFPDSEIAQHLSCKRTKARSLVVESLGKVFLSNLYSTLSTPGSFFSIIMDETTDISVTKQCAFTVIYYDEKKNCVATCFFDIVELSNGSADDLYDCLKTCITSKQIPLENLVGFSSDTPHVMTGHRHSVFSLLKKDIPHIVCIKCSCHMLHLAASKACLKLPRSIEDLLRNIGSHFSRSACRQNKFKEFQTFFHTEIHKILSPSITRWLSLKACVDRVLEQFVPLKAYFRQIVFDDPSVTTENMLETMENKFSLAYLQFMSYTLNQLTKINLLFQSEKPLLHRVKPEIETLLKILCSNYIQIIEIKKTNVFSLNHKNPNYFLPLQEIYLGNDANQTVNVIKKDVDPQELERFFQSILNFYIELVTNIKNRFDFTDPIFEIICIVEPTVAQSYTKKSLHYIIDRFGFLKNYIDIQLLDDEWKHHALMDLSKYDNSSAEKYWPEIFKLKNIANVPIFPNLQKLINFLMVLPFSNASVERLFSDVFNIKSDKRNLLNNESLKYILSSKQGIKDSGGCVNFIPSQDMLNAAIWQKNDACRQI